MGFINIEGSKELMNDPQIEYRPVPKGALKIVDQFIAASRGRGGETVVKESDWKFVEDILKFWIGQYPKEAGEFFKSIPDIRATRTNSKGYGDTKELRYIAALPWRLMKFIKIFFPFQQFDKDFMARFTKRLPKFKIGGY